MNDGPVPKPSAPQAGPRVLVSNLQDLPVDVDGLAALARHTLQAEGRTGEELSLSFVDPGEMEDLHVRYMDEPGPTDVLSFPMEDDELLGDVVVCPAVAAQDNPDLEAELRLLVVHGVLHLLGYDHQEEGERAAMWERQERYSGVRSP
jgi:probable rRNA maturation factor